jgi:hexosaminidase
MEKYINSKGKKIIGWDEILEGGLAPNAAVMSWRGEAGGIAAAKQQHEVVMTPTTYVYFDYSQTTNDDSVTIGGFLPLDKVYNYEPWPKELGEEYYKYISGAQANLWTEYIAFPSKVEYMIFPRMTALSEVLWSKKEKKNLSDFENRLRTQFKRYDLWRASYSKAYFDLRASVLPTDDYNGVLLKFESKTQNARITWTPSMTSPTLNTYDKPILINKNVDQLTARLEVNGKLVNTVSQSIHYNKATGKKITIKPDPSKNYPGDGAFTLVNGIVNDKGLARSREFLGWSGDDLEAIIDLGSAQSINSAIVHTLSSGGSWVYPPAGAELFTSDDGQNFKAAAKTEAFELTNGFNGVMKLSFSPVTTRYVKIVVKNYGIIPADKQGAGNKSWLFVDEIEID